MIISKYSILQNSFFEFGGVVKEQISCMAIGTKCASSYTHIFMDEFEISFIEIHQNRSFLFLQMGKENEEHS